MGCEKEFMQRALSLLRGAMRRGARSWANVEVIQLVRVTLVLIAVFSTTDHRQFGVDQLVRVSLDVAFSSWFLTSCSDVRRRGGADAGSSTLRCQAT